MLERIVKRCLLQDYFRCHCAGNQSGHDQKNTQYGSYGDGQRPVSTLDVLDTKQHTQEQQVIDLSIDIHVYLTTKKQNPLY